MAKLRVTLIKSGIGYAQDQKKTLKALGLNRLNKSVLHNDNSSVRGMLDKVRHLIRVEEEN
ncbi:50S ribosomal protein L30 [subsurface metagenome]|uniref:Large ribosomal subunit protein uL30-like ferredoxin-like fold domain-containing protein n=1 Tax=marine sediment metagenome TaxID=412755 RepID=X1UUZ6_9ZZZZ